MRRRKKTPEEIDHEIRLKRWNEEEKRLPPRDIIRDINYFKRLGANEVSREITSFLIIKEVEK